MFLWVDAFLQFMHPAEFLSAIRIILVTKVGAGMNMP
jgi:hypothetical protein